METGGSFLWFTVEGITFTVLLVPLIQGFVAYQIKEPFYLNTPIWDFMLLTAQLNTVCFNEGFYSVQVAPLASGNNV